jgi:uncharacterized membrane protein (UPF0127 family)
MKNWSVEDRTAWNIIHSRSLIGLFVLVLIVLAGPSAAHASETLTIETQAGGKVEFTVELAITSDQRSVGLMHRDRLDPMSGMLFIYPNARPASMWMRGTRIPLDMLFIASDGRIIKIRERAVPYSEEVITSEDPVVAVLEVNGGTAARFGIQPGDIVQLPTIAP